MRSFHISRLAVTTLGLVAAMGCLSPTDPPAFAAPSTAPTISAPSRPSSDLSQSHRSNGGVWLTGPARVVDGDTLEIGGLRVRLEGIDAPEAAQTCDRRHGGTWPCGNEATRFLASMIRGDTIDCQVAGRDAYKRILAICFAGAIDVNAAMVRHGMAWAFVKYSTRYAEQEKLAQSSATGIWQADAQPPWEHRSNRWADASNLAPDGCAIKGNVSSGGRIYHMPWSPWYTKVVVRAEKGARWFCSEADAIAAGWRPALTR